VINFRYHVVSLTAVFLALAIGLVVGTAALNGPLSDALKNRVDSLTKQTQSYRDQINQLETEAGKQEQFTQQAAPIMLAGKLTGRHVLVVSMPQTGPQVVKVLDMLRLAGATVTGQVEIQDKFVDPNSKAALLDTANIATANIAQPGGLTGLPTNSNGVETASFLLATVLTSRHPAVSLATDAAKTVLTAFKEDNFIVPTGDMNTVADAVVLVAGGPYNDSTADVKNNNVVTMVDQFANASPTGTATGTATPPTPTPIVVAATGAAGPGNVISAVRGDPTLSKAVATVDNVTTPDGQVAVPLALAEYLTTAKPGHYGVAAGAAGMLPKQKPAT
jgi:Copper transport outer membrane protein, MctB